MSHPIEERNQAESFTRAVDRLLAGEPGADAGDVERQADLALARRLSQARYVPAPQFEARLRNRLLNQAPTREVTFMNIFRSFTRPMLIRAAAGGLMLGVLLAISLAVSPSARAAAQRLISQFVEVDSPWALLPSNGQPAADGPGVAPAQNAPPAVPSGQAPALPNVPANGSLISLQEAQAKVNFTIHVPSSLPDGYSFLGVVPMPALPTDAPKIDLPAGAPKVDLSAPQQIEAPQAVLLVFGNSSGDKLMLSEMRLGGAGNIDVSLPAAKGSVQEVSVNGQTGQYIEGAWTPQGWSSEGNHQLHFQGADGITYDLTSPKLGLKELLATAESIK